MQTAPTGRLMALGDLEGVTPQEREWLAAYRREVEQQYPGMLKEMVVFGSKARGDASEDSDLDVLVVLEEGDWKLKEAIARPGYLLAVGTDVVPSLMVYTASEWAQRRQTKASLWQSVDRDGVVVP